MKRYIIGLMLACCMSGYTQEKPQASFVPPFNFSLTFSGNFGELRSNHFHNGLDFKTGGTIGKPVRAIANGYIARIRVTNGSGYVLDVCYENGLSSTNRHLNGFMPAIAARVEQLQYEKENWEVEIVPSPDEYPIKAGEQIAWSGNTGFSMGPHLHMEVYETASGDFIDPILFFKNSIKDTFAPRAQGVMLFPQPGKGVVNGSDRRKVISPNNKQLIEAWGLIGTGIRAYDYMNGVGNHYGVYQVSLSVDGQEVFCSKMDRFSQDETRMINSWTYAGYMKSFIDPGNRLRALKVFNDNRGLIDINEEKDYLFCYTLQDAFGNTSRYKFTVRGKRQEVSPIEHHEKFLFEWDKTNYLQEPGMSLVVPRGMLYDDVPLYYNAKMDSNAIAFTYQLNNIPTPLHGGCELSIGLRKKPVEDSTKYYMVQVAPNGRMISRLKSKYEKGFVKANIRELGTYTIALDTVAPKILPLNSRMWGRNRKVVFRFSDGESGIRSYRGTIDGKFALFRQLNITRPYWECELDPKRVKKGSSHVVEMIVTDNCGNQSFRKETFIW